MEKLAECIVCGCNLDARLMLSPLVSSYVRRRGLVSDDPSIDHDEELAAVMPYYRRYLGMDGQSPYKDLGLPRTLGKGG